MSRTQMRNGYPPFVIIIISVVVTLSIVSLCFEGEVLLPSTVDEKRATVFSNSSSSSSNGAVDSHTKDDDASLLLPSSAAKKRAIIFSNQSLSSSNSTVDSRTKDHDDYFRSATYNYFKALPAEQKEELQWIQDYLLWHESVRQQFPGTELLLNKDAPMLMIVYLDSKTTGGLTDRMMGIGHALKRAHKEQRILLLKWHDIPLQLEAFLVPRLFNWTLPNHPDVSTPERMIEAYGKNHTRIKLTNFIKLGYYLKPFGFIWNAFFRPSPMVQKMLDEAYENLGFMPGQYDAVHCRVGHPAFKNKKKDHDPEADRGKGYVFEGENKILAISTAVHGIQCSKWLAEHHYGMQQQSSQTNNTAAAAFPVYFYADSSDLVRTIVTPNSHNTTTPEEQALLAILSNTTTESFKVVGRPDVPIAHISPLKKKEGESQNQTSLSSRQVAFANTFVDLYFGVNARCVTMGVGRFAYMATQISATKCRSRHQTPSRKVSLQWGMKLMNRDVPLCPVPTHNS